MPRLMPLVALLLFVARSSAAHDQWLKVEPFRADRASNPKVYLLIGEHFVRAEEVPSKNRTGFSRFELRSAAGLVDLLPRLRKDQGPIVYLDELPAEGTYVIALDSGPRDIELPPQKFKKYLREEHLTDILVQRAENGRQNVPGRERYSRRMKALFQLGPEAGAWITKPVGQELEIVPTLNPYSLKAGDNFSIRVLFKGEALANRVVTAANRHRGKVRTRTVQTDATGTARLQLERSGEWMLRLVHMEKSVEPEVDWRSWWASLTFQLRD